LPPVRAALAPDAAISIDLPQRKSAPVALPAIAARVEAELPRHQPPAAAAPPPVLAASAPRPKPPASGRVETPGTPPLAVAATRREATAAGQELAVDAAATNMSQQKSIANSALPVSIRKQLPPLTVAVHAYSDTPQERLVSINGRMLREGDTLAPDLRLEQITPEGMIFTFRGYRFQRAAQ
jgi:general secretion pathway protein B